MSIMEMTGIVLLTLALSIWLCLVVSVVVSIYFRAKLKYQADVMKILTPTGEHHGQSSQ